MYKIGLSSCGKTIDESLFAAYAQAGIAAMEISVPAPQCEELNLVEIARLARTYGVELWSYHLPFAPFSVLNPASFEAEVRRHTIDYFARLIAQAAEAGIDKFVVHASGEPIAPQARGQAMARAMESLDALARIAERANAVIAVENLPRSCLGNCAADMEALLSANGQLKMCYDTNHLLGEDMTQFLRQMGRHLITTHISDYDFVNERHWLPGEGKIDWKRLVSLLEEVGYEGVWMYEIDFCCPKTILRDRNLTCADFARNAAQVLSGQTPTIFSKPKPNLGFWE